MNSVESTSELCKGALERHGKHPRWGGGTLAQINLKDKVLPWEVPWSAWKTPWSIKGASEVLGRCPRADKQCTLRRLSSLRMRGYHLQLEAPWIVLEVLSVLYKRPIQAAL